MATLEQGLVIKSDEGFLHLIASKSKEPSATSVLEIGCFTGSFVEYLGIWAIMLKVLMAMRH